MSGDCGRCRFWLPADRSFEKEEARLGLGWCRRLPPVIVDRMAQMAIPHVGFGGHVIDSEDIATPTAVERACLYPATSDDAWCGEFNALPRFVTVPISVGAVPHD